MSIQQRRARDKDRRRQRIITTARQLAEAEGWDSVTTRRLAGAIEYSQPVLYSHFQGKNAIIQAVALEGFAELATALRAARQAAPAPQAALLALARAYLAFAQANPALYEAMFTLADLPFAQPATPAPLREGFAEFRQALAPLAGDHDLGTLGEITWSTLHGLATLTRSRRLRPDFAEERLTLLIRQLTPAGSTVPPPASRLPDSHHDPLVQAVAGQAEDSWRAVEPDRVARVRLGEQHPPGGTRPRLRAHQPGLDGGDRGCGQVRGHPDRADDLDAGHRYVDLAWPASRLGDDEALRRAVVTALEAGQSEWPEHRVPAQLVVRHPRQQRIVYQVGVADFKLVLAEVLAAARYRRRRIRS